MFINVMAFEIVGKNMADSNAGDSHEDKGKSSVTQGLMLGVVSVRDKSPSKEAFGLGRRSNFGGFRGFSGGHDVKDLEKNIFSL